MNNSLLLLLHATAASAVVLSPPLDVGGAQVVQSMLFHHAAKEVFDYLNDISAPYLTQSANEYTVKESGGRGLGAKRVIEAASGGNLTSQICELNEENLSFAYCVTADFQTLPFPVNKVSKYGAKVVVEPVTKSTSMVYWVGYWVPYGDQTGVALAFGNLFRGLMKSAAVLIAKEPRRQFVTQGFVRRMTVFSHEEVAELRGLFNRLEALHLGGRFPAQVHNVHMNDPDIWKFVRHPELVRLTSLATGVPNLHILASTFCTKYPPVPGETTANCSGSFGWHQDVHYWDLNPKVSFTTWIAIDPVTRENGCLKFIPGPPGTAVHHLHRYDKDSDNVLLSKKEIDPDVLNTSSEVCIELAPGEMSVHDGWTVHGSAPNMGNGRRAGFAINWIPAGTVMGPSREGYGDLEDGALIEEFRLPVDPQHEFPPKILQTPPVHPKLKTSLLS